MTTTHKIIFTAAEQFFYDNASYSHDPAAEPAWSGRARCALRLAEAEARLKRSDAYVAWEPDEDADEPGQWAAMLLREDGSLFPDTEYEVLANVGGVDFAEPYEVTPEKDPRARVIAAELALEAGL